MLAGVERRTAFVWAPSRLIRGKHRGMVPVSVAGALLVLVWVADIFLLPFWESYQGRIIGGIVLIVIETLLICWLVQEQIKERRVQAKSIEGTLAVEDIPLPMGKSASVPVCAATRDANVATHFIPPVLRFDARDDLALSGHSVGALDVMSIVGTSGPEPTSTVEDLAIREETERTSPEEVSSSTSGRLIEAQEDERRRIAREIHDDYNQRLAVIAIDIEELAANIEHTDLEASRKLHQLWSCVSELGNDLHALSHSLHSSTLENLGLVAGVRAFCEEFSDQQDMQIIFTHDEVSSDISEDAALCLFRVVQEAVRNVMRHSGVGRAEVHLEGRDEKLHLSVTDHGRGFDLKDQRHHGGIGIRSMEERLHLIGGDLEIHSHPGQGTRVDAWLPIFTTTLTLS